MKKTMLTLYLIGIVIGLYLAGSVWADEKTPVVEKYLPIETPNVEKKPLVQIAILLDTSDRIDQARAELWAIVNEFIFAKRNGRQKELQI
jgi:hypothetical protein